MDSSNQDCELSPHGFPIWKRALDLSLILVSLPVWLGLFGAIALYVRVSSPGPIVFRQERIGQNRKRFVLLKFRSMRVGTSQQIHDAHVQELCVV